MRILLNMLRLCRFRPAGSRRLTWLVCLFLLPGLVSTVSANPQESASSNKRPRIALVLSGGGAKGAAHLGVLKVLEQMHVPVDIVVGTSMGSFVGGLYAMGYSADEVSTKMLNLEWNKGYQDKVSRQDMPMRRKQQADEFQLQTGVGVSDGKVKLPEGVYQGHGMSALLREATSNLPAMDNFDALPIPYRAVATDMEKVEPVVLNRGSIAIAMQASMSIPGALKPVEWGNKLLADGGVVNNLPVDVALSMGADVVIAVDISDRLKPRSSLTSAISLVDQLTTYLTRTGTDKQIALLRQQDLLLTPEVASFDVADFAHMPEMAQRGESSARGMAWRLKKLALSPKEYEQYQQAKLDRRAQVTGQPAYFLDQIEIHNHSRLSDDVLKKMLSVETGKVQTNENLEQGIERINALGTFERVTYQIDERQGKNVLVVDAREKSWGPGYLDFTLGMEDDYHSRSNYSYGVSYTWTNLNELGAEWRNEFLLGSWKKLRTELYSPFDAAQHFYAQIGGGYQNETRALYLDSLTLKDYGLGSTGYVNLENSTWAMDSEVGWNLQPWNTLSLGVTGSRSALTLQLALDQNVTMYSWGPYMQYRYDTLDNLSFPRQGDYLQSKVSYIHSRGDSLTLDDSSLGVVSSVNYLHPFTFDERHTLDLRLSGGGSAVSEILPMYLQDLGGLFNLSGYQRYQLNGRYKLFGALVYRYRLLENNFGAFKSPVYTGFSLERGNIWNEKSDINWNSMKNAASIYVGADTFLGPVYLAYGQADSGDNSFYLFFGNTFGL